jgi:cell wall-associated NlpC family hydrolase
MRKIFLIILLLAAVQKLFPATVPIYAVANEFTPVLNSSDFESVFGGKNGNTVALDNRGLIKEMEYIAFPNTVFTINNTIDKAEHFIYEVTTEDYPYTSTPLYIDSRFVTLVTTKPAEREKKLPSKEEILKNIGSLEGYPYMWGGNYGDGIDKMLDLYAPKKNISEDVKSTWKLRGVDCSGLLYQATNGATPRNTSSLVKFGSPVDIQGKSASEIVSMLQPLDLIVWSGHVVIVYDESTTIESAGGKGVIKSDLKNRISSILSDRIAVNDWAGTEGKRFVIRRWYEN